MKRRSFLAAASAAAGCAALGIKAVATSVKLLPSEYSAPYDVMWDGTKWIKDPFIKIDLGWDSFSHFILMTSHGNLQFGLGENKTCIIKNISKSYSFIDHMNKIPLETKCFDKGEFYAETLRQFRHYKIDFYEIHNHVVSGGVITTYSNLYASIGEELPDGH